MVQPVMISPRALRSDRLLDSDSRSVPVTTGLFVAAVFINEADANISPTAGLPVKSEPVACCRPMMRSAVRSEMLLLMVELALSSGFVNEADANVTPTVICTGDDRADASG